MKEISLSQGRCALVDDEDYDCLSKWKWYFNGKYAVRKVRTGKQTWKTYWMHREIAKTPDGLETDHENLNKLDNQKSNLRTATKGQNQHNRPMYARNKTGFKGVSLRADNGKFRAIIAVDGKLIRLGQFPSAAEAAQVYNAAASRFHGDFARTNCN